MGHYRPRSSVQVGIMNRYNWLIPVLVAAVIALLAALGITEWSVAVWPIGTLILAAVGTWIITYTRQKRRH